jgi:hypothetical protein
MRVFSIFFFFFWDQKFNLKAEGLHHRENSFNSLILSIEDFRLNINNSKLNNKGANPALSLIIFNLKFLLTQ